MMVRRPRQWVAVLLMLGLAFAQVVTAAHACSILGTPPLPGAALVEPAVGQAMPADCPEMAKILASTVNACVSHCELGQQVDVYGDAPMASVAPRPPLVVRLVGPLIPTSGEHSSLVAALAAPPPQLLFSRFLI
jgi:hypothetical protein